MDAQCLLYLIDLTLIQFDLISGFGSCRQLAV